MKKLIFSLLLMGAFVACDDDDKNEDDDFGKVIEEITGGSESEKNVTGTEKGHAWVDLGLPSGTKWATCNVGAETPDASGNYYAWGETETKESYSWNTYKWGSGSDKISKYCTRSKDGTVDDKSELEDADDVAVQLWGGKWKMPTRTQIGELFSNCFWVLTDSYNGKKVFGYIVYKAKMSMEKGWISVGGGVSTYDVNTDAHIFLPLNGYYEYDKLRDYSDANGYWTRTLHPDSSYGYLLSPTPYNTVNYNSFDRRYVGYSVRPVVPGAAK